jgi:hypothetical protein
VSEQNGRRSPKRPSRPYRDSALLYAVLGAVVVGVSLLTGGGFARALIAGTAAFLLATGWTWWRLRVREGNERR